MGVGGGGGQGLGDHTKSCCYQRFYCEVLFEELMYRIFNMLSGWDKMRTIEHVLVKITVNGYYVVPI